jgi:hypothetical protein
VINVRLRQQDQPVAGRQAVDTFYPRCDQVDDGPLSVTVGNPPVALGELTVEDEQRGAIFGYPSE